MLYETSHHTYLPPPLGCGRHAGGQGYNSSGNFCGGWAGNCGEGGSGGSSWYLICDRCRGRYLREKGGGAAAAAALPKASPVAAADKSKGKYANNKKNNKATTLASSSKSFGGGVSGADKARVHHRSSRGSPFAGTDSATTSGVAVPSSALSAISPGDLTAASEPHHLMKQNAMFLLELAPSHSSALPLTCNTPSPGNVGGGGGSGKMTPVLRPINGVGFHSASADFDAMLLPAVQESSSPSASSSTGSSVLTPSPLSALGVVPTASKDKCIELTSNGLLSPDVR